MNTLQPQGQQPLYEPPFDAGDALSQPPTPEVLTPLTPLSEVPDMDVKTEVLVPRIPRSHSRITRLRISIPLNPQTIKPLQIGISGAPLPPYVPKLTEGELKPKTAEAHTLDPHAEVIDWNGDLVLNFICKPESSWNDIDNMLPFLRLRVSSAVVQGASKILKLLTEVNIPGAEQQTPISLQPPRLHGLLVGADHNSQYLIISNDRVRSNVPDALRILFYILHWKIDYFPLSPKPVLVARVAEVAWLLDCVDSVVPWIQSQLLQLLDPKPSVEALQRAYRSGASMRRMSLGPYENLLFSFAIGDQRSFLRASLDYVLLTTPAAHEGRVGPSVGIMATLGGKS